jgi:hypothetical protein
MQKRWIRNYLIETWIPVSDLILTRGAVISVQIKTVTIFVVTQAEDYKIVRKASRYPPPPPVAVNADDMVR